MIRFFSRAVTTLLVLLMLTACQNGSRQRASGGQSNLIGTLQGGMAAIGGETTGWILVADSRTEPIEVDVSGVSDDAQRNNGRRVLVSGRFVERKYVERGPVRILRAERIAPIGEQ